MSRCVRSMVQGNLVIGVLMRAYSDCPHVDSRASDLPRLDLGPLPSLLEELTNDAAFWIGHGRPGESLDGQ